MFKGHEDETVPAQAVWHVAYALRVALTANADEIREYREALNDPETNMLGVFRKALTSALANAERMRAEMLRAFTVLPPALRPDPIRYPLEIPEETNNVNIPDSGERIPPNADTLLTIEGWDNATHLADDDVTTWCQLPNPERSIIAPSGSDQPTCEDCAGMVLL
jgi:hypothetical protein